MTKDERALIDEQFKNVHLILKNGFKNTSESLKRIMEYNEYQNGRIASAINRIGSNEKKINDIKENPALKPIFKKPYLFMAIGFIGLLIIGGFLNLDKLSELIKLLK